MLTNAGFGNPVNPVGLIASGFRPSDDACVFPFLVPSNLLAVASLRQLAEMANSVLHDAGLASRALSLAAEVGLRFAGMPSSRPPQEISGPTKWTSSEAAC